MLGKSLRITLVLLLLAVTAAAATIPYGTKITVVAGTQINSATAKTGDRFQANLASDLVVNGKTLAKTGAPVKGKVTFAKSSGRLHDPGQLSIRLTAVEIEGKMVPISTSAFRAKGKSHTKSNVTKIGGGTAAGAVLGGVFGGGKGALIGAAAGGAAGTGLAAATGKEEAVIHAETAATFTMTKSATVR
jgi:uncharacterized cupredoxin-like copper-binding protein